MLNSGFLDCLLILKCAIMPIIYPCNSLVDLIFYFLSPLLFPRMLMVSIFDLEYQGRSWPNCMGTHLWKLVPHVVLSKKHIYIFLSETKNATRRPFSLIILHYTLQILFYLCLRVCFTHKSSPFSSSCLFLLFESLSSMYRNLCCHKTFVGITEILRWKLLD